MSESPVRPKGGERPRLTPSAVELIREAEKLAKGAVALAEAIFDIHAACTHNFVSAGDILVPEISPEVVYSLRSAQVG
jgi:hypothetical protein